MQKIQIVIIFDLIFLQRPIDDEYQPFFKTVKIFKLIIIEEKMIW